jgi:hypothetical protein
MTTAEPCKVGVLRRLAGSMSDPNSTPRRIARSIGKPRRPAEYYLSDTVEDAFRTAVERKFLANRLRPR